MSSRVKTYFLAPNWTYPPDGLIQLGTIIADPTDPSTALNSEALITPASKIWSPEPTRGWRKTDNTGFDHTSDCVFAYQIMKIRSRKHDKVVAKIYNKHALLDNDPKEKESSLEEFDLDWEVENDPSAPEGVNGIEERLVEDIE